MHYDIVIIGAGLVGSSLTCALSKRFNSKIKIALLEKLPESQNNILEKNLETMRLDGRALALTSSSIQFFKNNQIWPMVSGNAQKILEVHVSSQGRFGVAHIKTKPEQSELGMVVNADVLNHILIEEVKKIANLHIYRPVSITDVCRHSRSEGSDKETNRCENQLLEITLKTDAVTDTNANANANENENITIQTNLIIAADGAHSFIRKHHGIGMNGFDYQQTAILTNIQISKSHQNVAFERFLEEGTIAFLPFGSDIMKCVWIVPNTKLEEIMGHSDKSFLNAVQNILGYRLGRFIALSPRVTFPLKSNYAENIYGHRFVLVGNAANTLHPVAAQGFNLGLRDVASLVEILFEANHNNSKDFGDSELLKNYAAQRRKDHSNIRQITHQLTQAPQFHWGLNLSILGCEFIPTLNNLVAKTLG